MDGDQLLHHIVDPTRTSYSDVLVGAGFESSGVSLWATVASELNAPAHDLAFRMVNGSSERSCHCMPARSFPRDVFVPHLDEAWGSAALLGSIRTDLVYHVTLRPAVGVSRDAYITALEGVLSRAAACGLVAEADTAPSEPGTPLPPSHTPVLAQSAHVLAPLALRATPLSSPLAQIADGGGEGGCAPALLSAFRRVAVHSAPATGNTTVPAS